MFKSAHELVLVAKRHICECTCDELQERNASPNWLVIDVREPEEYAQGHIAGAINIPRGILEFKISNEPSLQDLARPIIVYCKTSGRAALSVATLGEMGFKNVVSLKGGFDSWISDRRPTAQPKNISFE